MRSALALLLGSVLLLSATVASASDLYILNGTIHPVSGPAIEADMLIRDGRIHRISDRLEPRESDEVIDASGMLVTPGLIDFDTQIGLVEIWAVDQSRDGDAGGSDEIRSAFRAADAINPQSVVVDITRRGGVTSVITHPGGGLIAGQSAWLDMAGDSPSQMIVQSPVAMVMQAGAAGGNATGGSRASALMRYRELFTDIAAMSRDQNAYDVGRMRDLSASRLDMLEMNDVMAGDLPVYLSANRASDIQTALSLTEEFGLDLILRGGAESWYVADELAALGVTVVVDPMRNAPYSFEQLGSRSDTAAILDRAGVQVVISTGSTHNSRLLRQYAGNAVRAGMDWDRALAAVTLHPARAVGMDADYGTLETGRVANIVVWTGDPFELSTRVRHVIVAGESVDLESRQTELFRRYRRLEEGVNTAWQP